MLHSAPPDLQSTHVIQRRGGVTLVVHREWLERLPIDDLLAGAALERWGRPLADHGLVGRGRLVVLETPGGELVAKALSRGGLLGPCLPSLYADPWRPAREALLCESLRGLGVPTAVVAVARATRVLGGLYRCEIATVRLPGAVDLLAALQGTPPRQWSELAGAVGRTLGRLHEIGLVHRDLQVKNLLVPAAVDWQQGLLAVIDLDACRLDVTLGSEARLASLTRFARSLVKRGLLPRRGGGPGVLPTAALRAFIGAYASCEPGQWSECRAELLRSLTRRLSRQLAVHGLFWRRSGLPGKALG